jgi:hypothetical protein
LATIADLRGPFVRAGIPIETAPDFYTNGRDGVRTLRDPTCGYLHHTVATQLVSVYWDRTGTAGWPHEEWRPSVPSPRCNLYGARARRGGCRPGCPYDGRPHVVFVSNGKANHAGMANLSRIQAARAGRINHGVSDAADAGLPDNYSAAGFESVGWEFDWNVGESWPAELLDMAAAGMRITADELGWEGVGCWILHRQATDRKIDWQYTGDIWTRARTITTEETASMADNPETLTLLGEIKDEVRSLYKNGFSAQKPDGTADGTHEEVSVRGLNVELNKIVAGTAAQQRLLEQIAAGQVETNRLLAAIGAALPADAGDSTIGP